MKRNRYSSAELTEIARRTRRRVIEMVASVGIGYVQQGLGAADIFTAIYFSELRLDEADPTWDQRDRCVLSAAHNTAVMYATFAERGLIPADALKSYMVDGSPYEVNASERIGPLVEATCGSLGQGLSVGLGFALGARKKGLPSRIYVILGDGELQEGQTWEAAMCAADFEADNLCLIIDRNGMQVEGHTDDVLRMEPLAPKWEAFGWRVIDIDGNDVSAIVAALDKARETKGKPTAIIARTIPGYGVPSRLGDYTHFAQLTPADAAAALKSMEEAGA